MSMLDQAVFFTGPEDISEDDLGKVEVANFTTDVGQALKEHFGWGKLTGTIGLTLSPDNLRINKGVFITRRDMELKEKKMAVTGI